LVRRPGYGTVGIKTEVGTNYLKFQVGNMSFWYYNVTFQAEVSAKRKVKQDLLEILLTKSPFDGLKNKISHNGSDAIYSTAPLPISKEDEKVEFTFAPEEYRGVIPSTVMNALKGNGKSKTSSDADPKIFCTVEFIHKLNMDDLTNWVKMNDKKNIEPNAYISALNVVLGYQIAKCSNVFLAGKSKFFFIDHPEKCQSFQKGLFIANGYFASVLPTYDNVMINVRPVAGAFIKAHNKDGSQMSVADLVADYFSEPDVSKIPASEMLFQRGFFKGIKIQRAYLGHKSKPKGIFDISKTETANNYKFDCDGKQTSVAQYFADKYKMKLKFPDAPLIHLGGSNYVPMEACMVVPGQEFKGEITDVRGVLSFSTHRPHVIAGLVQQDGIKKLTTSIDAEEARRIGTKLVVVPSRVLSAPVLEYKNTKITFVEKPADGKSEKAKGSWDLINKQFYEPVKGVKKLTVLVLENSRRPLRGNEKDDIEDACTEFINEVAKHGVKFDKNFVIKTVSYDRVENLTREIVNIMKPLQSKTDYVLSILNQKEKAIYASVKTALDRDLGILNQCTLANKFAKRKFGKFDIQMYALMSMKTCIKLGGANHVLSKADVGKLVINGLPTLLLGADVTHPTNNSNGTSIAAVVGSVDDKFNSFPGSISVQEQKQETISEMSKMCVERIMAYYKSVGKLPQAVLFYRDGVSLGQFNIILDEEVTAVKNSFKVVANNLGVKFDPKLTFVTILKSHNTRFFPLETNAKNAQNKDVAVAAQENIMPGSIVEKGVTSRSLYDFFLQSQQALQGTAIPGHYYVLYDENHWSPDELQKVTYNLCSIFGRATKSVRVVPPAYYADLLCERATCFVQNVFVGRNQNPFEAAKKALGAGIHKNVTGRMIYI
jgi:eukaryotic translation initiation factor 2C